MTTWTNATGGGGGGGGYYVTTTGSSTTSGSVMLNGDWNTGAVWVQPFAASLPSPVAPETPLQWLDREIERTCALARMG